MWIVKRKKSNKKKKKVIVVIVSTYIRTWQTQLSAHTWYLKP